MRIVFECYAIYSALICTVLTLALALGFDDNKLELVARKIINISFLIYGPVMTTICMYGVSDVKSLARICTLNGISSNTNYVSLFVLFSCFVFSMFVSFTMAMERTMDMAQAGFTNEHSVIYKLTAMYYQVTVRIRERRSRESRRERRYLRD